MIPIVLKAFGKVPALGKVIIVLALLASIVGGLWRLHYLIDKGGYDRAMGEVRAAAAARDKAARETIIKTEKKYAKIRKNMQDQGGHDRLASPLVGLAIDSVPDSEANDAPR